MIRPEKKEIVKEITEKLKKAKAAVLTDFRGLDVHALAELRRKLREQDVEYKVFKNTLLRIAVAKQELDDLLGYIEGPTALAFGCQDAASLAKTLVDFSKEHEDLKIKGGFSEEGVIGVDEIKTLASLPTRDELVAMLVRQVESPLCNLVSVLGQPTSKLVATLNAIAQAK